MSGFYVNWNDAAARDIAKSGGEAALREAAEALLAASRAQVPLDSGALAGSGEVSFGGAEAAVSYGAPYACRWHEQPARFRNGRKNKYLEDPCNDPAVAARMLGALAGKIAF